MKKFRRRGLSLAVKGPLALTMSVTLAVAVVTLISLRREQQTFETELQRDADVLLATMVQVVDTPLFQLDIDTLRDTAEDIQASGTVLRTQMFDAEGRMIIDSEQGYIIFDLEPNTFGQTLIDSDETVFVLESGRLLAGRPVTAGNQAIGAIAVTLSTEVLEQRIIETRNQGILVGLGAAVIGAFLSLFISRSVTAPLGRLTDATKRVAEGDFSQKVTVNTRDELETVADSFNTMTDQIQKLISDLEKRNTEVRRQYEELKKVNLQLDVARIQAEEASQIKSQFLATMSHELRTPLNAINGFSQIMLAGMAGEMTPKQRTNLERILSNGEHLLAMVNDILDLSKIESGMLSLLPKPITFPMWMDGIKAQTESLIKNKELQFVVEVDEKMPEKIVNDEARLRQIALNLISNAVKFTEEGEIKVSVQTGGDNRWQLLVSDTGIGIPLHAQDLIFEEFRQVDGTTSRVHEGTGLGLAIVRRLALLMGGSIKVKSKPGEGSTFTVELPLNIDSTTDDKPTPDKELQGTVNKQNAQSTG